MVIAITPGETWEWVHDSDLSLPEDERTIFVVRVLTPQENRWIENRYAATPKSSRVRGRKGGDDSPAIEFRAGDYREATIRCALEDVRGLKVPRRFHPDEKVRNPIGLEDVDPNELVDLPFSTETAKVAGERREVVSLDFLGRVPAEVQVDLANAIQEGPGPSEADRKN